jgi:hypothetical protein
MDWVKRMTDFRRKKLRYGDPKLLVPDVGTRAAEEYLFMYFNTKIHFDDRVVKHAKIVDDMAKRVQGWFISCQEKGCEEVADGTFRASGMTKRLCRAHAMVDPGPESWRRV